jgi:hypothetical protein
MKASVSADGHPHDDHDRQADVRVCRDGSLILFRPVTSKAEQWLRENTVGTWFAGALVVNYAGDLAQDLAHAGFLVADE